jgi:hypothetical protein
MHQNAIDNQSILNSDSKTISIYNNDPNPIHLYSNMSNLSNLSNLSNININDNDNDNDTSMIKMTHDKEDKVEEFIFLGNKAGMDDIDKERIKQQI